MITIIIYIYILSYYYILLVYYYCYRSNHWIELPHCWDSQVRHRRPTSGRPPWPAVPNMAFFGVCFFLNKILKEVIQYQGYKTFFFSVFRVFFASTAWMMQHHQTQRDFITDVWCPPASNQHSGSPDHFTTGDVSRKTSPWNMFLKTTSKCWMFLDLWWATKKELSPNLNSKKSWAVMVLLIRAVKRFGWLVSETLYKNHCY